MQIILLRHAETIWNQDGRWQGHTDVPLSPIGMAHIQASNRHAKSWSAGLRQVYASDLTRALTTAEGIFPEWRHRIITDVRLREIHFGDWEGKKRNAIAAAYADTFNEFDRTEHVRAPGGESFRDSRERVLGWYRDEAPKWGQDDRVVVVAHGGTIRALLFALIPDLPGTLRKHFRVDNLSVSVLETTPTGIDVLHWNLPIEGYEPGNRGD